MTRTEETNLRSYIRKGILNFFRGRQESYDADIDIMLKEHELRIKLRNLIFEAAAEDPTVDVHDNTGINTLKDLLKNSNILSTLRNVYKTLTTSEDQKRSFRAHIIKWVQDTLAPVKLNDTDALEDNNMSEAVDIDVRDEESPDQNMMIDADDGAPPEEPQEDEDGLKTISGEDTTGRNKAERVYPTIEKSVIDYYGELDNPEDQEMFYDYLIANLKLYFDKWDGEMSKKIEEPTNDQYEQSKEAI